MVDDIVERLKSQDEIYHQPNFGWEIDENKIGPLCMEAAAEIERLRAAIFEKETVAEIRAAAASKNYVTVNND